MKDDILLRTWLGIGLKTGGIVALVGMENTEGKIFNLKNTTMQADFSLLNARLGVGLGGGTGLVAMCVFNCPGIEMLHNTKSEDWGVTLSVGGKWAKLVKTLKNYKFFTSVARIGPKLKIKDPKDLETIRNSLHYIYSEYEVASMGHSTPKVIVLDTPVGAGLEISISYSLGGKIEISN